MPDLPSAITYRRVILVYHVDGLSAAAAFGSPRSAPAPRELMLGATPGVQMAS
jgi:hypothetical protein